MAKVPSPSVAYHDFYKTNGQEHPPFVTEGPSLTRQEFAEECDINSIMARYDGYLSDPMRSIREPTYYDFTDLPQTLLESMEVLRQGEEAFFRLPALVRREFDNNPAAFVDFAANPENLETLREWGLAEPIKAPEPPMKVEVVNPAPAPANEPGAPKAAATHGST